MPKKREDSLVNEVFNQLEIYMNEANKCEAEWKNEKNDEIKRRQAKQEMKKQRRCSSLFLDILAQKLD